MADMTLTEFLNNHWLTIAGLLGGIGSAISVAVAWLAKVVWARIEAYWAKRDARDEALASKQEKLVETLTVHAPKHTELLQNMNDTQRQIADDIAESRKRDSDFIREVHQTKEAAVELSYGLEALAVEDILRRKEETERYMRRARERLGVMPKVKGREDD